VVIAAQHFGILRLKFIIMKNCLLLFICLPILAISQNADSVFIKKLSDEILTNGKAYEQLRHLTKKIGGRLAGSPQMVQAEKWGAATLREVGADKVIMQETMVPHWVRGGQDKASIISINGKSITRPLDVLALGNSLGTGKKGVKAEVLALSGFDELEKRKNEVKGKIVFFNYPFNDTYIHPGQSYGEQESTGMAGQAWRPNTARWVLSYVH
jgi:carboxypeptidase Q